MLLQQQIDDSRDIGRAGFVLKSKVVIQLIVIVIVIEMLLRYAR